MLGQCRINLKELSSLTSHSLLECREVPTDTLAALADGFELGN